MNRHVIGETKAHDEDLSLSNEQEMGIPAPTTTLMTPCSESFPDTSQLSMRHADGHEFAVNTDFR